MWSQRFLQPLFPIFVPSNHKKPRHSTNQQCSCTSRSCSGEQAGELMQAICSLSRQPCKNSWTQTRWNFERTKAVHWRVIFFGAPSGLFEWQPIFEPWSPSFKTSDSPNLHDSNSESQPSAVSANSNRHFWGTIHFHIFHIFHDQLSVRCLCSLPSFFGPTLV